MISLPGQLFSNTHIPACIWVLSKDKSKGVNGKRDRRKQILFFDLRLAATGKLTRTQIEFSDLDLERIGKAYHRWRSTEFSDEGSYVDEQGFCKSVGLPEIALQDYSLSTNLYVRRDSSVESETSVERQVAVLKLKPLSYIPIRLYHFDDAAV